MHDPFRPRPISPLTLFHFVPVGSTREQLPGPRPHERVYHDQVRAAAPEALFHQKRGHLVSPGAVVGQAAGEERETAAEEHRSRQLRGRLLGREQARVVDH